VRNRPLGQLAAVAVSVTFLLVGALGCVPGITTSYDDLSFAGPDSAAQLVGLFQVVPVDVADNVLHVVLGVGMLALGAVLGARSRSSVIGR
jgi:hypothetical protein